MDTDGRRQFNGSLLPVPCSGVGECTYVPRGNAGRFSFFVGGSLMVVCSGCHVRVSLNGPRSPMEMLVCFLFCRWQFAFVPLQQLDGSLMVLWSIAVLDPSFYRRGWAGSPLVWQEGEE